MHMKGLSQWGLHSFVGEETRGTVGLCHPMAGGAGPSQARGSLGSVWASWGQGRPPLGAPHRCPREM